MQENESNNLFDIRLNHEGVTAIKKFAKIAKWVMLLIILFSLISVTDSFASYFLTNRKYSFGNKLVLLQSRIYPYYTLIYCGLAVIQTFNYLKVARNLSAAINNNDEIIFNRSFIYLFKNSIFAVLTLSLGFLMVAFRFYILIESFYIK